jgi:tetratricopeptide (TPR) repeat protein
MVKKSTLLLLAFMGILVFVTVARHAKATKSNPRPIRRDELMALVSGHSLPENIAYELNHHGVCSAPTDHFKTLLSNAGAASKALTALNEAKIINCTPGDLPDDSAALEHMSRAGAEINAKQFQQATEELTSALNSKETKSAAGFVMGEVLIEEKRTEEAVKIYEGIEKKDFDFPQIHTRLSFVYFNSDDFEDVLTEAKLGQERNPEDPSALMNAGVAFTKLRQFDAAKTELQAAIRYKPDLASAYQDLGLLFIDQRKFDDAIEQAKKAIALDPNDPAYHYDLGFEYADIADYVSAIREYREAKRLDPNYADARQALGEALMHSDPGAAITEFRELAALKPDRPICHFCLGDAYYQMAQYDEAKKEYVLATQLDPASAFPHAGLGRLHEMDKDFDAAIAEFREAERLNPSFGGAFTDAGRVLLAKKDFASAIAELKRAEEVDPTSWQNHDFRGQAFEGAGDRDSAVAEYNEALSIAPKELQARLDLALALEKRSQWVEALQNYRRAAADEKPPRPGFAQVFFDAQQKYATAQQRFQQHLSELRAAGKSDDAGALEANLRSADSVSNSNVDDAFHSAMNASGAAMAQRRFDEAETKAKQAIDIAEKIKPQDGRLPEAVGQLGNVYAWRLDFKNADATFKRQLLLLQTLYGPKSPMIAPAIWNQGMVAMAQKDFAGAENLFSESLDLNEKTYGENSNAVAEDLRALAHIYKAQYRYDKAEAEYLHVIEIYKVMYGPDDYRNAIPYATLCQTYDQWGKPEKSQECHAHMVSLEEKQFGATSSYLAQDLNSEAQALRQLGRTSEAATVESRAKSLHGN